MAIVKLNEKILFKHFTKRDLLQPFQEDAWYIEIKGVQVSVIKFTPDFYNGDYEIWSDGELFEDVERFATMVDLLKRLTELNSSKEKNEK